MRKTEFPITNQFLDLKTIAKGGGEIDLEKFEEDSAELLKQLSECTIKGMAGDTLIETITLDLWKDRVWHLIERVGLLPEYIEIEEEEEDGGDDWYLHNPEFDFPEMTPILTKHPNK